MEVGVRRVKCQIYHNILNSTTFFCKNIFNLGHIEVLIIQIIALIRSHIKFTRKFLKAVLKTKGYLSSLCTVMKSFLNANQ